MRKTIVASTLALAAFAFGSEARAWGLHNGDTLNPGDNMIYGEVGWPDLTLGFQHGLNDKVDIGFRFSLDYGLDYTTITELGLGMRVPIRITPYRSGKLSFQVRIEPGLKFDSFGHSRFNGGGFYDDGELHFGLQIPIGLDFGIHLSREATLAFGFDMPLYINLTNGAGAAIPLLFGPGFEYHVNEHIALGLNTRFGPSIFAVRGGSYTDFGLITQGFFAYRL